MLSSLSPCNEPIQRTAGSSGLGEGLYYQGKAFYYRVGKHIPKTHVVHLTSEDNYCGRQKGDFEYIIVAWDGTFFVVLDHVFFVGIRDKLKEYKGLSCKEAIALVEARYAKLQAYVDARPKCACGHGIILFHDDQRRDECSTCYDKRRKK